MKIAIGIVLCALPLFTQPAATPAGSAQPNGPVFTVTSTLVQVDAVVTDGRGHNVADLKPNDFEVSVDGKPQPLTHFSYVRVAGEGPAPRAATPTVLAPVSVSDLRPEDVRRTLVMMVDDLGLSFESMLFVRRSLRSFVETQMQPGDLVAVVRTGAGSGALQQFTTDKRVLLSIIEGLRWNPNGRRGLNLFDSYGKYAELPDGGDQFPNGAAEAQDVRYEIYNKTVSTVGTLGSVSYIVDALREMPGRKSIVLFSDGLQLFNPGAGPRIHTGGEGTTPIENDEAVTQALRKLIDRANRAGTVIYTMQATGLTTGQLDVSDKVRGDQTSLQRFTQVGVIGSRQWFFNLNQQGLAYIADKTGGRAYDNGNDLNVGLNRVLEDQKGYYLLGFHPPEGLLQEKHRTNSFHKIAVRVTRAGLHVRSRSGFFGATDDEVAVAKPATAAEQVRAAMLSPFRSSGIHLRLTALYAETARGPVVRNLLHIDAKDLTWRTGVEGYSSAFIDLVTVATGDGDIPIHTSTFTYEMRVASGRLDEAQRDGVVYTMDVRAPKRGAYQIRAAVRDSVTGKVGSASQFIEVPDLKKAPFVLSSIVLQDSANTAGKPGALEVTPARRQFRAGAELAYLCAVQKGKDPQAAADLATRIRIVRDGKEVFSSPAKVEQIAGTGPAVFGLLRLTDAMPPGDYYLQVLASDSHAGRKGTESQWTDFKVTP